MKISLVMIVKNEEKNLEKCLKSIENIVDEIIIVDTGSNDGTIKKAKSFDAKVFYFEWCNNFSAARNYGLEQAEGDWILVLDADECVSVGNRKVLEEFARDNEKAVGRIEIHSKYEEEGQISYSSEYVSRFFPRGIKYEGIIHEQLVTNLDRIKMNFRVEHSGYFKVNKCERNLKLLLEELKNNKNDPYILYQIGRTLYSDKQYLSAQSYFEQAYKIIENYSEVSYRKNLIIYYLYSIVKRNENYKKGLEIIKREERKYFNSSDFNFVCGIFYMNLVLYNTAEYIGYMGNIEKCYLNCLTIGDEDSIVEGTGSFKAMYNLGTFYEVTGKSDLAYDYYKKSERYDFEPAKIRLKELSK